MITDTTDRLYSDMQSHHLMPLWTLEKDILPWSPKPKALPWLWKWSDLYEIAERSGALVPIERGGDRRAIALANPGLGGLPHATPTLWAADMFVIPGWAWHEHCNASSEERATLFSIQDTPVMRALNKYREEAYTENDGHQSVTGVFRPAAGFDKV